ncbi:MAG: hypothetical protein RJA70_4360 [Pseudomonadota bacterium]|jgi:hypothetical protein
MRFLELALLGLGWLTCACHAPTARCGWGDPKCGIEPTAFCETADAFRPVPGEPQVELGEPIAGAGCILTVIDPRRGQTEISVGRDQLIVRTGGLDGTTRVLPLDHQPARRGIWEICETLVAKTTDCIPRRGRDGNEYYLRSMVDGETRVGYAWSPTFTSNAGRFVDAMSTLATVAHAPEIPTSHTLMLTAFFHLSGLSCLLDTRPSVEKPDGGHCDRLLEGLGWRE